MIVINPNGSPDRSEGSFHHILANFLATGFFALIAAFIHVWWTGADELSEIFFWGAFLVIGLFLPYVRSMIIFLGIVLGVLYLADLLT